MGTADIDPYARAAIARTGALPVGLGDGVAFVARTDDRGRPLDGGCDVTIAGVTPQARYFTLTLYDTDGKLIANALKRQGFTRQETVPDQAGGLAVTVT